MSTKDFWRFKKYCSGSLSDIVFLEWKYFGFSTEEIEGFICYSIGNPNNVLGMKRCILSYAIYHEGGDEIGYLEIHKNQCDLKSSKRWFFGPASIEHKREGGWRIKGETDAFDWDLNFSQIALGDRIHVDLGKSFSVDSWMDWIVICNSAEVEGELFVDGKTYEIKGVGYIDSNLGHWIPSDTLWTWGHGIGKIKDEIVSFSLAQHQMGKTGKGRAYLSLGEDVTKFRSNEYELDYDIHKKPPSNYHFKGFKEDRMKVEADFKVERTDKIRLKAFRIFPLLDLVMQRGNMDLKVKKPGHKKLSMTCRGAWEFPSKPKLSF